jgi:hypothetical protein
MLMFIKNLICNLTLNMLHAQPMRNTTLKVTKHKYCKILSIIGKTGSVSAYEIMNSLNPLHKPTPPRHVYRMVMSLSGQEKVTNGGNRYRIWSGPKYLNTTLKPKILYRIAELEKERNNDFHHIIERHFGNRHLSSYAPVSYEDEIAINEVEKMCSESGNYRYSLSIRGLLLLLYCDTQTKITLGKKEIIREVLDSSITLDVAPFLLYWKDFEQAGFDVINTLKNLAKESLYYITDEKTDNDSLLLTVTQRYSNEVSGYFYLYDTLGIIADKVKRRNQGYFRKYIELNIPNKMIEYRRKMLSIQKKLLSNEIALVERRLEADTIV